MSPDPCTSAELNFERLCAVGGYFCLDCQRFRVPLEEDHGLPSRCNVCKRYRLKWCPPVPGVAEKLLSDPASCHV